VAPDTRPFPFTPEDQTTLTHGASVDFNANMLFQAMPDATYRYTVQLFVNKKKYGKFEYTLLKLVPPSFGSAGMGMTWPVEVTGPKHAIVTLRVVITSSIATTGAMEYDTVHNYTVACNPRSLGLLRFFERQFGRCE
jgi:hypothetical protein